jgi:hypothetical protein
MDKAAFWVLIMVGLVVMSSCSPEISPQEAKVLVALGEIQRGIEADMAYDQFVQRVNTAKAEIAALKKDDKANPCFQSAVERSYASYEIARKAWIKKMQENDENRKADLDMTLSFSLSFSSINIERANKCYN